MSFSSIIQIVKIVVMCWVLIYLTPFVTGDNNKVPSQQPQPPQVIAPHCSEKCGDVSIPYPFGIEDGCFYKEHFNNTIYPSFKIFCYESYSYESYSSSTPKLENGVEVLNISILEGELLTNYEVAYNCYNYSLQYEFPTSSASIYFRHPTFTLSSTKNILVAIGCDTYAWFQGYRNGKRYYSGCIASCVYSNDVIDGECTGVGCCEASFPSLAQSINLTAKSFYNHTQVYELNPCSVAFFVARDAFEFRQTDVGQDARYYHTMKQPVVFNWAIGQKNCSEAKADGSCLCKQNAECYDPEQEIGYRCNCSEGYSGNPYIPYGCTDIDECKGANDCEKPEYCFNTYGGHYCKCPKGYQGTGTKNDPCNSNKKPWLIPVFVTAGVGVLMGSIMLLIFGWWLHSFLKKRLIVKQQRINSEINSEMLRRQMLFSEGVVERIKIFTINELTKATDDFNKDRVLGRGGNGTVYKGMLGEGRIVAVKRSKKSEENQREEFINEVVVMSQISHRNILKLLGCCLETQVPLLVYEFIPNGTLYQHIHNPSEEFTITWKMRLQIASDTAGALAYLHSSTSTLIFHRDIKSSNILLDNKYRAKLSDFGTSRSVAIDQTHVVNRVMGTFGYMDPEYFQSQQFTEKSDVYSFGVVLVELLTGEKAVRAASEQDRSLTSWFLSHMENSCVLDIVDSQVLKEGSKEELLTIANLAMRCLHLDGKKRPTMKEVLQEIEAVLSLHMPQTYHDHPKNTPKFEQASGGTATTSTQFGTFSLENNALDSADLSLLFNPR